MNDKLIDYRINVLKLNRSQAARRIGINRTTLLYIENGRMPKVDTAQKIARTYNGTVEDFFSPKM